MAWNQGDHIQVVAHMKHGGKDVQNVFHALIVAAGSNDDTDQLEDAAEWVEHIYDAIDVHMPTTLTFDSISVYNLTQDVPHGTISWPTLVAGTGVGLSMSPALALVARQGIGMPKREGRKYFGPWISGQNDAGGIAAPTLVATVELASIRYGIARTSANGATIVGRVRTLQFGVYVFAPIQSHIVNNEFDIQRRRKISVGS